MPYSRENNKLSATWYTTRPLTEKEKQQREAALQRNEIPSSLPMLNESKKTAPIPDPVSDIDLDLLIETLVYSYIDRPTGLSKYQNNLLSALLELKEKRNERT